MSLPSTQGKFAPYFANYVKDQLVRHYGPKVAFGGGLKVTTSKGPLTLTVPPSQHTLQIDDFARCILENRDTRVPGEMGRRDMVIIDAIYEAARTGKRVEVKV